MYCKIKENPTPSTSPPTTAPTKESKPPMTAAIKPETKSKSNEFGESVEVGVITAPAIAPVAPAKAQPILRTRLTRTPASWAISGWKDAARRARPRFVYLKITPNIARTPAQASTIKRFWGENGTV